MVGVGGAGPASQQQAPVLAAVPRPGEDGGALRLREDPFRVTPCCAPGAGRERSPEQRDPKEGRSNEERVGHGHGIDNYVPKPDAARADNTWPYSARLRRALDRAVELSTGGDAKTARQGQADLADSVMAAMVDRGRLAAEAPTGSGKSLAVLVPAMLAAAAGERTVVSTETLGLQAQMVTKDGPAAAKAVSEATGYEPVIAPLKGWSNFGCALAASRVVGYRSEKELVRILGGQPAKRGTGDVEALAAWVLLQGRRDGTGDRADCDLPFDDSDWAKVSVAPMDCPGQSRCPFGEECRPRASRARAAGADVVVANHSLLAMQAVTGAPVVIGGEQLGLIDHLVVDEAHALADKVRAHGTVVISGWSVMSASRALEACLGRRHKAVTVGVELAKALDAQLVKAIAELGEGKALDSQASPFDGLEEVIETWAGRAKRSLKPGKGDLLELTAASSRLDDLVELLRRAERPGTARWLESGDADSTNQRDGGHGLTGAKLTVAPIETAGAIAGNLFGPKGNSEDSGGGPTAIVLSATLPASCLFDLGVGAPRTVYPSPFEDAYKESLLYVPKLEASSPLPLGSGGRFDVAKHQAWAEPLICRLVAANQGSALVLAATSSAGRGYAEALRSKAGAPARWRVHSQWDGPLGKVVQAWRDDIGSVLVGTRGLMTGVDAPGDTCSLVIVDRVPRAAPNPVDDARRDALAERLQIDRWAADRMVYVADAVLLLSQAAGRLIRSSSDRGVVAVLDPRLLKGPIAYPEPTRKALLGALQRFPSRTVNLDKALSALAKATFTGATSPAASQVGV